MIAIIDYKIGNISAVANMLNRIGAPCKITSDPIDVERAERIILPGNGSFDACMRNLQASGLINLLEKKVLKEKTPLLGICVGAQMLGIESEEGQEKGLGWLNMRVRRFPNISGLKIPHMGWNKVKSIQTKNKFGFDVTAETRFYFIHSYYMDPVNQDDILLETSYGIEFAAGVCRENIVGVQFHPEKSHRFGKELLTVFAKGS